MSPATKANQSTEHIHKLKRHTYETGSKVFFCALPKCKFKTKPALALGKESLCWRCGYPFIMNEYSIRLAKPHCEDCHKSKGENATVIPPNAHLEQDENQNLRIMSDQPILNSPMLNLSDRLKKATTVEDEDI